MCKTSNKDLEHYNSQGLIPGPSETEEAFLVRAEYCLNLQKTLPNFFGNDLPFSLDDMHTTHEILQNGYRITQRFYDICPTWVPLFFSNFKLSFWHGGCAWIFQHTPETPTSAFFQLRQAFRNSKKYWGLYDRTELISHELSHVGRMKFEEPRFEEILAYRSSKSNLRRFFGPIVQSSIESMIFVLLLLFLIILDTISLVYQDLSSLAYGVRLLVLGAMGFGLFRLFLRQWQFSKCMKALRTTFSSAKQADAVSYRLTDEEIVFMGKSSPTLIKKYALEQQEHSFRWKMIYSCYFKNILSSDHYDGTHYHNVPPTNQKMLDVIKWMIVGKSAPWPKKIPDYPFSKPPKVLKTDELLITFVNHSTLLIQWGTLNFLTDPIWSERCSPLKTMGPKRVHAPGIHFDDLPPIDYVLLSHNHYDHMDLPTLYKLQMDHNPLFITGLGNQDYLYKKGLENVVELDWWEEIHLKEPLQIVYTPAQHFSMRHPGNRNQTLWGGFVIKNKEHRVYFAGDTAWTPYFSEIHKRLGSPHLSFLPIGAFEPRWFMKPAHMSPEEAVKAHLELNSRKSIAIHYGTFHLADESLEAPVEQLKMNLKKFKIVENDFLVLKPGENYKDHA